MTQKEFQNAAEAIIAARPGVTDKQIYNALGTDAATATPQNQRKM